MQSFLRREFLGSTREDDERSWRKDKSTSLGMPPWHPPEHSRRLKHLILGMPKESPLLHRQPSGRLRWNYVFITSHSMLFLERHFILLSVCVILFAGHVLCWILAILCGGETRSAFSLKYSCASLIFCWVFLAFVFLISCCASLISF